jgi:hypothetical protein
MRLRVFSLLAALAALIALPVSAEAGHRGAPRGWGEEQVVHHYGYYPRYRHVYHRHYYTDPYAYEYEPRRYYPYYNSGYWRPTHELRYRRACCRPELQLPRYYQAWGYPKRHYKHHRKWHRHHGRHHHHYK